MRGSQAYGRVCVVACAHRASSSSVFVCVCVRQREKEHILCEVPGLSRGVSTVQTHYSVIETGDTLT